NTIPLRANLSGNPTFTAFLAQVSDTVKQCFAHDAFPFSLMVERLQPERTINVSPIFQVAFAWQKTTRLVDPEKIASFALGEEGAGVQMGPMLVESAVMPFRTSPFDMTLWIAEAGDDLGATLEYSHDLFEHETASRMLGHYEQLLKGIAENADRPISDLPLLTERERRQIPSAARSTTSGTKRTPSASRSSSRTCCSRGRRHARRTRSPCCWWMSR